MLQTIKQKKEEGFTIIEVLIVLAIAGLIMVVVFLAVPALQRNSRNNSRKTEANNLMSAVSEVSSNKGGGAIVSADLAAIKANTKNSFYAQNNITIAANAGTAPGKDSVQIIPGFQCGTTPDATPVAGNARETVVWYAVESGSSTTTQCVAS